MAIPESFIEELLSRSDIEDVVSSYVTLSKRSGSNLFGLCPFHSEKTPSFSVSPEKQIYHCFGCGKGGSAINFIMEIEGLSFPDAVAFLARRVGMQVPDDDTPAEVRNRRSRMLDLNRDAARFFFETLSTPQGAAAVEYINKRRISKSMVRRFGLGCAPDAWTALSDAMISKGYTRAELLDAGLAKRSKNTNGGTYDTFRDRLMFPVIDVRGSVIGFSGRALGDGEPKYLNSPDTLVFNKSRNLFALNLAKKTKQNMIILVEGNVDVVSLHQAGFDCAVASLGTSLTPEQARLISRYTHNVVLAYDSDAAGVKAAQRAIGIFDKVGMDIKVLRMAGAKDPDEYINKFGADAFKLLIEKSENDIDYRLMNIRSQYDLDQPDAKIEFINEVAQMLATVENSVAREVYGSRAAEMAGVSAETVQLEIKRAFRRHAAAERRRREREELRPSNSIQPSSRELKYDNVASAAAEEGVIRLLLLDQTLISETDGLTQSDFSSPFLGKMFEKIRIKCDSGTAVSPSLLAAELQPAESSQLTVILSKPESMANGREAMRAYTDKIRMEQLKNRTNDLKALQQKYKENKGYGG